MTRGLLPRGSVSSVVAGVSMVFVLTACSGYSGGGDVAGVDGAATSDPDDGESSEDAESPDDDGAVDRPDIKVADSLEMVFEEVETDDPVEKIVLKDNERHILSVYEMVTNHDAESSISFYAGESVLLDELDFVAAVLEGGQADAGSVRYYNRHVTVHDDGAATVTYCRDASEVYLVDFESGEMTRDIIPSSTPTHFEDYLEESEDGVWQTLAREFDTETEAC